MREKGTHLDMHQNAGTVCRRSGRLAALLYRRSMAVGLMLPIRPTVRSFGPESPQKETPPTLLVLGCERPHELLGLVGVRDAPRCHDAADLYQPPGPVLALAQAQPGLGVLLSGGELLWRCRQSPLAPRATGSVVGALHAPNRTRPGHPTGDGGEARLTEWRTYANSGFAYVCRAPSWGR